MKNTTLLLCLLFSISTYANNNFRYQKLVEVNKEWLKQPDAMAYVTNTKGDADKTYTRWIKTHLMLVEKTLRHRDVSQLTAEQRKNRTACLNNLHQYWQKGVFPINDYVSYKTPVFIDRKGTHCAVGYLMQTSGYDNLAQTIDREQKFAYVHEIKVNGVKEWAQLQGFTLDELAWIQPTYACMTHYCNLGQQINVSCYGGYDGCVFYDPSGLVQPTTWEFFPGWDTLATGGFYSTCDLNAGKYHFKVLDGNSTVHYFFYTITQPDSIAWQITKTDDYGTCNGTANISVSGGVAPYTFWTTDGQNDSALTALCTGWHTFMIFDANHCYKTDSVYIAQGLATGSTNKTDDLLQLYPNPTSDYIELKGLTGNLKGMKVVNANGDEVRINLEENNKVNIKNLPAGIYYLTLTTSETVLNRRFLKI